MKITQDDLLDALREALQRPAGEGGQTVQELAELMGCGDAKVRHNLRRIARDGRLVVSRVLRQSLDGRTVQVPGYRVKSR